MGGQGEVGEGCVFALSDVVRCEPCRKTCWHQQQMYGSGGRGSVWLWEENGGGGGGWRMREGGGGGDGRGMGREEWWEMGVR